jgi:hypothetical protein
LQTHWRRNYELRDLRNVGVFRNWILWG